MSSLINPLIEYWMVDNTLLLDSNFIVLVVYLALRPETLRMPYMSTPLFDTRLVGLKVINQVQPVIGSDSQSYEGY